MNIIKNRTVLGLICIVLSLIICFGLTPLFNGAVKSQTEIVRMVKDVKKGEKITSDMVATVKVGGYNLPDHVLKEKENIIRKYARHDLQSGDYILSGKVSDTLLAEFTYLHELDGTHQAISITIKSFAAGLSGKLEAGDIVSLIVSDVGDFRETLAPPELQYVKVIAVTDGKGYDKEYTGNSDEEKELPNSITLLVVPVQARLLTELEVTGKIHCTLVYRGTNENCNKFLKLQEDYLKSLTEETNPDETEEETGTENKIGTESKNKTETDAIHEPTNIEEENEQKEINDKEEQNGQEGIPDEQNP